MPAYDVFSQDASSLKEKKLFLLDLDGTVYQENRLFDGTKPLLQAILNNGGRYVFLTNNSSKSASDYVKKLDRIGIAATYDDVFTSGQATAMYLLEKYPGQLVYCQGTRSLIAELESFGVSVTESVCDEATVIVTGYDTELTAQKLRSTCEMLLRDLPYIATNEDLVCPVSFGFVPDCGSVAQMLENASGKKPLFIGKPKPTMIDIVCEKFSIPKSETVMVGDRLYTDIAAGINAGITSVCVLSGESSLSDVKASRFKPTFVLESVADLAGIIGG